MNIRQLTRAATLAAFATALAACNAEGGRENYARDGDSGAATPAVLSGCTPLFGVSTVAGAAAPLSPSRA